MAEQNHLQLVATYFYDRCRWFYCSSLHCYDDRHFYNGIVTMSRSRWLWIGGVHGDRLDDDMFACSYILIYINAKRPLVCPSAQKLQFEVKIKNTYWVTVDFEIRHHRCFRLFDKNIYHKYICFSYKGRSVGALTTNSRTNTFISQILLIFTTDLYFCFVKKENRTFSNGLHQIEETKDEVW